MISKSVTFGGSCISSKSSENWRSDTMLNRHRPWPQLSVRDESMERKVSIVVAFTNFSPSKSLGPSGLKTFTIVKIYCNELISDQTIIYNYESIFVH